LRAEAKLTQLLEMLEQEGAKIEHFQLEDDRDRRIVTLTLDSPSEKLLARIGDLDFVQGISWGD
jgi:hypothetical protein